MERELEHVAVGERGQLTLVLLDGQRHTDGRERLDHERCHQMVVLGEGAVEVEHDRPDRRGPLSHCSGIAMCGG